jgi:hypothetical protein
MFERKILGLTVSVLSLFMLVGCNDEESSYSYSSDYEGYEDNSSFDFPSEEGDDSDDDASSGASSCGDLEERKAALDILESKLNELGFFFKDTQGYDVNAWSYGNARTVKVTLLNNVYLAKIERTSEAAYSAFHKFHSDVASLLKDCGSEMGSYSKLVIELKGEHAQNYLVVYSTLDFDSRLRDQLLGLEAVGAKIDHRFSVWDLKVVGAQTSMDEAKLRSDLETAVALMDEALSHEFAYQTWKPNFRSYYSRESFTDPYSRDRVETIRGLFQETLQCLDSTQNFKVAFAQCNQTKLLTALAETDRALETKYGLRVQEGKLGEWTVDEDFYREWKREDPFRLEDKSQRKLDLGEQRELIRQILATVGPEFLDDSEKIISFMGRMVLILQLRQS